MGQVTPDKIGSVSSVEFRLFQVVYFLFAITYLFRYCYYFRFIYKLYENLRICDYNGYVIVSLVFCRFHYFFRFLLFLRNVESIFSNLDIKKDISKYLVVSYLSVFNEKMK